MVAANNPMDLLCLFLDEHNKLYVRQRPDLVQGMQGSEEAQWSWIAIADEYFMKIISYVPTKAAKGRRVAAMEYITRANLGLHFGNFEIDLSDGAVFCRTSISRAAVTQRTLPDLIFGNFGLMERYLMGLMSVIHGNTSPRTAIAAIENPPASCDAVAALPDVLEPRN